MKLLTKTDKTIEIEFAGENETLLNLLKTKLLANPDVAAATFIIGHPLLDHPRLVVTAHSGKPEQHVRQAAKELRVAFDALDTAVANVKIG
ncbi:MAG TPA: RpoL/Rpb11 RNA polymerase subunit family protein [Candidatus Thermoplasmatota archaeon]|nr:RpoL/Rpb11 RNA polymerase subunit family protein [Candidatus Thermoplasmatota archaeon]